MAWSENPSTAASSLGGAGSSAPSRSSSSPWEDCARRRSSPLERVEVEPRQEAGRAARAQLAAGNNALTRPPVWNQPLSAFTFASDLKTFDAPYFQVPNARKNAFSQIDLSATEVSRVTEVIPGCACE